MSADVFIVAIAVADFFLRFSFNSTSFFLCMPYILMCTCVCGARFNVHLMCNMRDLFIKEKNYWKNMILNKIWIFISCQRIYGYFCTKLLQRKKIMFNNKNKKKIIATTPTNYRQYHHHWHFCLFRKIIFNFYTFIWLFSRPKKTHLFPFSIVRLVLSSSPT